MTTRLLLDGDPANDDALAVLVAAGHRDAEVLAVTAVAGHVAVDHAAHNAAIAVAAAGLNGIPVGAGAAVPLVREQIFAQVLDHEQGLDRHRDDLAAAEVGPEHGVDLLVRTARENPGAVLVATGPLTNVAWAIRRDPEAMAMLSRLVILGGAWGLGNKSAAAEFNILCDPEAASVVFESGLSITLVPVDATATVAIEASLVEQVRAVSSPAAEFAVELLSSLRTTHRPGPGPLGAVVQAPLHDPTAVVLALQPELAETVRARVDVETAGRHTYGRTVIDFAGKSPASPNVDVVTAIDADAVREIFTQSVADLSASIYARSHS